MSLEHILLGLLIQPASGYALRQEFDRGAKGFWSANLNQIYPTLERMEDKGWLKSRKEPSPAGPPRRVYSRTKTGQKELFRWAQSDPIVGRERFAYIGQLIFLGEVDDLKQTRRFLERLRAMLVESRDHLERAQRPLKQAFDSDPKILPSTAFHALLGIRMGVRSLGEKVRWCDECLEMIELRSGKKK